MPQTRPPPRATHETKRTPRAKIIARLDALAEGVENGTINRPRLIRSLRALIDQALKGPS